MTTLHEVAQTLRAINHEVGTGPVHGGEIVTRWAPLPYTKPGSIGYCLIRGAQTVAFIETLKLDKRIESHLTRLVNGVNAARTVVRALLNAEDYTSTMYDQIVRVHYAGDGELPSVPGNNSEPRKADLGPGPITAASISRRQLQRALYRTPDWRQDAYEPFDKKRYQQ